MSAAILPADPMIDVLTDAIASKRDTIALLERTANDAKGDLAHLRQARAKLLAKAEGFEVGQVWIVKDWRHRDVPAVICAVSAGYDAGSAADWQITLAFEPDRFDTFTPTTARDALAGIVQPSGALYERFADLLRQVGERKAKAA